MNRSLFYIWLVLVVGCLGVAKASDVAFRLIFELRIPKTTTPDLKQTRIGFVAAHGGASATFREDGTFLEACKQREEAGFLIFQRDFLIFSEDKPQRGLIVETWPAPAQVFRLSIPQTPGPADWSQWQRPSYVEKGDAGRKFFIPDSKASERSTNIPAACFEARYKIENQDLGKERPPSGEYQFGFVNKTVHDLGGISVNYGEKKVVLNQPILSRVRVGYPEKQEKVTWPIPSEAEVNWDENAVHYAIKVKLEGIVPKSFDNGIIFFLIKGDNTVEVRAIKWGDDAELRKMFK